MAKMWPKRLPKDVLSDPKRKAECDVYESLEKSLDDTFTVFYSRPWMGLSRTGAEIDGECDFLVSHPENGLLAIEVKGGGVSYDEERDRWISRDRYGIDHRIKNPVQQAKSSKYHLLEKLKDSRDWQTRRIRAAHGVIFPDVDAGPADFGPDMPRRLFCMKRELKGDLATWVLQRCDDSDSSLKPLGVDGMMALERLLAAPIHLSVSLATILTDDDAEMNTLTMQQAQILACFEDVQRASVSGGAGTGKTALAVEEAIRCSTKGLRTLLVCFNSGLASHLEDQLGERTNLRVCTFHGLCKSAADASGLDIPRSVTRQKLFAEVYPELLAKSFELAPDSRFDAIIVDEGQDFQSLWWPALDMGLVDNGCGILRVFHDSNQKLFQRSANIPSDLKSIPVKLTQNLRNTKRIHERLQPYYDGVPIESIGPEGNEVVFKGYADAPNVMRELVRRARGLIVNEGISPSNIVVLARDESTLDKMRQLAANNALDITLCNKRAPDSVVFDTVRRFKGMESLVILLSVDSELIDDAGMMYVALSRGRAQLEIFGQQAVVDRVRQIE